MCRYFLHRMDCWDPDFFCFLTMALGYWVYRKNWSFSYFIIIIIGRLSRFIEKINVKQMKNAKLNQKATAPETNFPHSFLF